jgi:hypothetical protein
MLLVLTNGDFGGLGSLRYDKATGVFSSDNSTAVVTGGVTQTAGLTYGQAANYIESMMIDIMGTTVDIEESDVEFVARAYNDILNRPAEGAGLAYWCNMYATGNYTQAEFYQRIVDGGIASGELLTEQTNTFTTTPNTIVSRDQFTYSGAELKVTERFDDLKAANYTDNLADDNVTRTNTVADNFSDLYESVLGRQPEAAGLEYWVEQAAIVGIEAAINSFREVASINLEGGAQYETGPNENDTVFTAE